MNAHITEREAGEEFTFCRNFVIEASLHLASVDYDLNLVELALHCLYSKGKADLPVCMNISDRYADLRRSQIPMIAFPALAR